MQNNDHEHQLNMLLAVVLSMALLFIWTTFFMPQPERDQSQPAAQITASDTTGAAPKAPGDTSAAPSAANVNSQSQQNATTAGRVKIETQALKGSISLLGGRLDDLMLTRYRETLDENSPNVRLLSPANSQKAYFTEHGWTAGAGFSGPLPNHTTVWTASSDAPLTTENPAVLTWDNGAGLTFKRTISVDDNYMFKVIDTVENKTADAVTLFPYARVYRYGMPKLEGFFIQHEGMIGVLGEEGLHEVDYDEVLEPGGNKKFTDVKGGWLGFTDKYWGVALIPDQAVSYSANMSLAGQQTRTTSAAFQADYLVSPITVTAGQSGTVTSHVFAGAKKANLIDAYGESLRIEKFDLLMDWGWFFFITKPLYWMLSVLYGYLGNFGLAILAVTVFVKILFFWPASRGYESMARMKKLQPEMEKLRERFKDNKERQQKELMELYRKEKINPLAGCLPILVQIPVFFALYKVLFISIDMRHAPFYGWIKDLSAPDPTSLLNLFGLLPYSVPDFLLIGIWPILMGVTMWLQMQLNPPQPDPTQQMIFNWMPVLFTFLLATFASGLVIYWTWNNVLSLIQQYFIMKKNGAEMHLMDNIKKTFAPIGRLLARDQGSDSGKT